MHLQKATLSDFKNFASLSSSFSQEVNCIVGKNGSGKTNLLDAIHYLCQTKSAFSSLDKLAIKTGTIRCTVAGSFQKGGEIYKVGCQLEDGTPKVVQLNGERYEKLSDHIGKFPVVVIAPDDTELVTGYSGLRRKMMDGSICQFNHDYLTELIKYHRLLKERNALLQKLSEKPHIDPLLLRTYDDQLLPLARRLAKIRSEFILELTPLAAKILSHLSNEADTLRLEYLTQCLDADFEIRFRKNLQQDIYTGRTGMGLHKDDVEIKIGDLAVKQYGSQGQKKSVLIALRLGQYQLMTHALGYSPILLLDDIFDKLDDARNTQLISLLLRDGFGQLFLTDARPERTKKYFTGFTGALKFLNINNGKLSD